MSVRTKILVVAASSACCATAMAGPAYQALKACLQNCINTTPRWSVARALCGADCLADYADSKISLSTNIDPSSSGYFAFGGVPTLDWTAGGLVSVVMNVIQTPLQAPIDRIDFRLFNEEFNTNTPFGQFLTSANGDGQSAGQFVGTFDSTPFKAMDGWVIAEIHYVGAGDEVDDVAGIYMIPTPSSLALAGLGALAVARRRR